MNRNAKTQRKAHLALVVLTAAVLCALVAVAVYALPRLSQEGWLQTTQYQEVTADATTSQDAFADMSSAYVIEERVLERAAGIKAAIEQGATYEDMAHAAVSQESAVSSTGESASASTGGSSSSQSSTSSAGGGAAPSSGETEATVVSVSIVVDGSAAEGYGVMASKTLSLPVGATVYDALCASGVSANTSSTQFGVYVAAIGGLAEKQYGSSSGWKYCVNGSYPTTSCSKYALAEGDSVRWVYVTG